MTTTTAALHSAPLPVSTGPAPSLATPAHHRAVALVFAGLMTGMMLMGIHSLAVPAATEVEMAQVAPGQDA